MRIAGPGARGAKAQAKAMNHSIPCTSALGNFDLRVVCWYKHLGKTTQANCDQHLEIKIRKTSCNVALGTISSRCLDHEHIELDKKINITRVYIFSRLTFSAGSWHLFNKAEEKPFVSAVMHI